MVRRRIERGPRGGGRGARLTVRRRQVEQAAAARFVGRPRTVFWGSDGWMVEVDFGEHGGTRAFVVSARGGRSVSFRGL